MSQHHKSQNLSQGLILLFLVTATCTRAGRKILRSLTTPVVKSFSSIAASSTAEIISEIR